MFTSQQRKPNLMGSVTLNETQAKEKLATYVYEYLVHTGAKQSAEVFKNEVLSNQNMAPLSTNDAPGFLHNWWCVFWDLYSAAPERREKYESSQEAKAFHEVGFIPSTTYIPPGGPGGPLMNGMHGVPQFGNGAQGSMGPGMPPNPDGIMSGYFGPRGAQPGPSVQSNQASPILGGPRYGPPGQRSGAPTPSNMMPGNFPPPQGMAQSTGMMTAEQMRNFQRMNPRMQPNFSNIRRPFGVPGQGQHSFIDSPAGTPPFNQNPMMSNGMCQSVPMMSSPCPGGGPPPGSVPSNPDGMSQHDSRFMMMSNQFGMGHHDGSRTPTNCGAGGPTSVSGMNNNGNGVPPGSNMAPSSGDNSGGPSGGQLQNMLNGGGETLDMKQSPASVHGNAVNGGTPGAHHGNPGSIQQQQQGCGPASCHAGGPGSVHSQSGGGAPGSVLGGGPHQTLTSEAGNTMDFQSGNSNGDLMKREREWNSIY